VKVVALLYHDVVQPGRLNSSGFAGHAADECKLDRNTFREHLSSISRATQRPIERLRLPLQMEGDERLLLTFDDGGVTAYTETADLLEEHGYRGHFFITSDYIDSPRFVTRQQLRELQARGHVIGTHSASHPARIGGCRWEVLLDEWASSATKLADILGAPVTIASIHGGYFRPRLAEAAALSGIRVLFTSEPTTVCREIYGCTVVGRFCVRRGMSAGAAGQIARGDKLPRAKQWLDWKLRQAVKSTMSAFHAPTAQYSAAID